MMRSSEAPNDSEKKQEIKPVQVLDFSKLTTRMYPCALCLLPNGYLTILHYLSRDVLQIYDIRNNNELLQINVTDLTDEEERSSLVPLSEDRVVLSNKTNGFRVCDIRTGKIENIKNIYFDNIAAIPDSGQLIGVLDHEKYHEVIRLDLSNRKPKTLFQEEKKFPNMGLSLCIWDKNIVTCSDKELKIWNLEGQLCGKIPVEVRVNLCDVYKNYLLAELGYSLSIFDLEKKQCIAIHAPDESMWGAKLLSCKKYVTAHEDSIKLRDLVSGNVIATIPTEGRCSRMVLSPDLKLFCVVSGKLSSLDFAPMLREDYLQEYNPMKEAISDAVPFFPKVLSELTAEYVVGSWAGMFRPWAGVANDDRTQITRPGTHC